MKDTFDLRKYLVENKMTENSRRDARRRLNGAIVSESGIRRGRTLKEYYGDEDQDAAIDFDELVSDGSWLDELGYPDVVTMKVLGHTIKIDYETGDDDSCWIDGKPFNQCKGMLLRKLTKAIASDNYEIVSKEW